MIPAPPPRLRAELVEDGGAAATGSEFFRSPPFLRAENATHSLVIDNGRVLLPLIRRAIPDGQGHDAISPYGYPGGHVRGEPPHVTDVDFAGTGLTSLFLRERIGEPALRGATPRGTVLVHSPSSPRNIHRRDAEKVRSNERRGYVFEAIRGLDVDDRLLRAFAGAYEQTMRRADAEARYFFDASYLRACLEFERSWLAVVWGPEGDVAAAAIAVVSDGYLHYFLGGTAEAHRTVSPAKNVMLGMIDLADGLAMPLNFGGGMSPGDGLYRFKANFANAERTFLAHQIVSDRDAYISLTGDRKSDFFPAYRTPRTFDPA